MESTSMIILLLRTIPTLIGTLLLTAALAIAQHDMGGGGATSGAASGGESTSRTTVKRAATRSSTVPRRTRPPVRRGLTAEQYNKQGDDSFAAKEYDDALEAYTKAVQLK